MKHQEYFTDEGNLTAKVTGEYFLGFIEGGFGCGKTLGLVMLADLYKKNYDKIYANFPIYLDNSSTISSMDKELLLNLNPDKEKKRILLLLQESYHYFDKRYCTTKYQKEIMEAIFQIRKTNIDILCDVRELKYLDFRAVENTTLFMRANGKLKINPNIFEYEILKSIPRGSYLHFMTINKFYVDGSKYYNLYNTLAYTTQKREVKKEDE